MNGIELLKNDHKRILDIINELINEFTGKVNHTNEKASANGQGCSASSGKL